MKFYLWERTIYRRRRKELRVYRRAHILQEGDSSNPMCSASLDLGKWRIVEELPETTHLCGRCQRLARKQLGSRAENV